MIKEVIRGTTMTEAIDFVLETCCSCGVPFFMPSYFKKQKLSNPGESFYCPAGHGQHYTGRSEAEKLKERLSELEKQKAKNEEDLQNKWLDALSEKNKLEKQLKRVHKGVCPCCNRTFVNLQRHMKTKHPEVTPLPTHPINSK